MGVPSYSFSFGASLFQFLTCVCAGTFPFVKPFCRISLYKAIIAGAGAYAQSLAVFAAWFLAKYMLWRIDPHNLADCM